MFYLRTQLLFTILRIAECIDILLRYSNFIICLDKSILRNEKKPFNWFEKISVQMIFNDKQFSSMPMANNIAFITLEYFAFTNSYEDLSFQIKRH